MAGLARLAGVAVAVAAAGLACGKTEARSDASAAGSSGAPGGSTVSGGMTGGGSAGAGARGGVLVIGSEPIAVPEAPLPPGCAPTPQASDWGVASGQRTCYLVAELQKLPHAAAVPTLLDGSGGAPGGAGAAGAENASLPALEKCPRVSELDWSCSVSEGRCCPIPQCEAPDAVSVVDGQCCYFVFRACGA